MGPVTLRVISRFRKESLTNVAASSTVELTQREWASVVQEFDGRPITDPEYCKILGLPIKVVDKPYGVVVE